MTGCEAACKQSRCQALVSSLLPSLFAAMWLSRPRQSAAMGSAYDSNPSFR